MSEFDALDCPASLAMALGAAGKEFEVGKVDRFEYHTVDGKNGVVMLSSACAFLTEPRVRHTMRCQEAQQFGGVYAEGNPEGGCVCTELERLHDDWNALSGTVRYALREVSADVAHSPLYRFARSRAALDDLHARIVAALGDERCAICRSEEGP